MTASFRDLHFASTPLVASRGHPDGARHSLRSSPAVSVHTFADWGVRRVSSGSLPYRAAMAAAAQAALAVRDGGPIPAGTPYGQMQSRLLAYDQR
jgi:2-methylisocitrate lyase-like PEP mutase family enzyme